MRLLGNSHRWLPVAAFVLLLYLIQGVARQRPFAYDGPLLLAIHRYSTPTLDRLMLAITQVGHPDTLVAIAPLAALLLRRRWPLALLVLLTCLGSYGLGVGLKLLFAKARPSLWPLITSEPTYSFPSGHTLGSTVLYGLVTHLLIRRYPNWQVAIGGAAAVLLAAIGFSRLYLGVHWPTDVAGGYAIGGLWLAGCIALFQKWQG